MELEYDFSFNCENLKNLSSLSLKQVTLTEQRMCEIYESASKAASVALGMLSDGMGVYEALTLISGGVPAMSEFLHADSLPQNGEMLLHSLSLIDVLDKCCFSSLFAMRASEFGRAFSENDFLQNEKHDETFTYVKNIFADEAFDVFSQEFDDPRLKYSENFREAVRLVNDGIVTYAILPLEEAGARITSIAELIYRFELKINSVIPVFGIDGTADIKYALVSKHFSVPRKADGDDRYLEIRLPQDFSFGLGALISAAECFGVSLYRVNTMSYNNGEERVPCLSLVFSGEGADFSTLLVYLTLFLPEYTAVGLYNNLEG